MTSTKVLDTYLCVFVPVMFVYPVDLVVFRRTEDRGKSVSR